MELWTIPGIYGERRLSREGTSFYRELKISKASTARQIHYAHKTQLLRYQRKLSDNEGNEEILERTKELNRIHSVLTDKKKRAIYDEYGSYGLHVSEKYGEDHVFFQSVVTSLCCQVFGFFTCGYCCFCCFYCCDCCCGLFASDKPSSGKIPQRKRSQVQKFVQELEPKGKKIQDSTTESSTSGCGSSGSEISDGEVSVITAQPASSIGSVSSLANNNSTTTNNNNDTS